MAQIQFTFAYTLCLGNAVLLELRRAHFPFSSCAALNIIIIIIIIIKGRKKGELMFFKEEEEETFTASHNLFSQIDDGNGEV